MAFESLQGKLSVAVHMLCTCIVFVFLVTSTPISQFKGKGVRDHGASKVTCLTAWGLKNDCSKNPLDYKTSDFNCDDVKKVFQATEAFYIIAVIVSCLECLLAGMYFVGWNTRIALVVLGVFEVAFALIPWVLMTTVWTKDYCSGSNAVVDTKTGKINGMPYSKLLRDNFKHSAGYGMTIAGWVVQIFALAALFLIK